MSMSKKDYEAISDAIRGAHAPWPGNVAYRSSAAHVCNDLLPHLRKNDAFAPARFIEACGLTPTFDGNWTPGRESFYGV